MELIIKAASQSCRTPLRDSAAASGMVPYMHSGEATPSTLAGTTPHTPQRPPFSLVTARWIASLAKTETSEPTTMPSTQ